MAMLGFIAAEAAAGEIEREYDYCPNRVDERQTEAPTGRWSGEKDYARLQPEMPVSACGERNENRRCVEEPEMQDVVEERDFAVGLDEAAQRAGPVSLYGAVEDGVEDEQDSEGGQAILKRRRVFLHIHEAHCGLDGVGERVPAGGVSIAAQDAQEGEGGEEGDTWKGAFPKAKSGKDGGAESVTETDGASPGDGRVGDKADWVAMPDERAGADHEPPEISPRAERGSWNGVEQIVQDDDCGADGAYCPGGQPLQAGEQHHGDTNRPDDLKERGEECERPGEADEGGLKKDQPQASREEQLRDRGLRLAARTLEVHGGSREGYKAWSTEVRDPARGEERRPRAHRVGGIDSRAGEEIAGMVESHQDHEQAAEEIDGFDSGKTRDGALP